MEGVIKIVTQANVIYIDGIQQKLGLGFGNLIFYNYVWTPHNSEVPKKFKKSFAQDSRYKVY